MSQEQGHKMDTLVTSRSNCPNPKPTSRQNFPDNAPLLSPIGELKSLKPCFTDNATIAPNGPEAWGSENGDLERCLKPGLILALCAHSSWGGLGKVHFLQFPRSTSNATSPVLALRPSDGGA